MDSERWERVKEIIDAALEQTPDRRRSFVATVCKGDAALQTEVERLLQGHERAGSLLASGPSYKTTADESSGARTFAAGDVIGGRFRVRRFLGHGGMGEVYEADDTDLSERVALKTILPRISADPNVLSRFKQEIHLARRVTHPNVCRIFDLEYHRAPRDSGKAPMAFLTMELLEGESLASRLRRETKLSVTEALPLIRQMAEGLAAAHEAGVIHRDFKPGNVMLVPQRTGERATSESLDESTRELSSSALLAILAPAVSRVVITDFGLAGTTYPGPRVSSRSAGGDGQIVGTLAYMAPEQLEAGQVTPATDVYALGLVMYEVLTGRQPFGRPSSLSIAIERRGAPPPTPRTLEAGIPRNLEAIITKCLEPKPESRYSNATEVGEKLRDIAPLVPPAQARRQTPLRRAFSRALAIPRPVILVLAAAAIITGLFVSRHWPIKPSEQEQQGTGSSPKRLAVLPFDNLSQQADDEYFADGLTAELITTLARVRSLEVISRTTMASFKGSRLPILDVAKRLDVGYVVSGSVQREGSRVRITVSLSEARSGVQMWARVYDRPFTDALEVESEVANNVVESLAIALGNAELTAITKPATQNPEAFDAYLRGKSLTDDFNNRGREADFDGAQRALRQAVALDPSMSEAYAEQAWLYFFHDLERARSTPDRDRARKAAEQSLALDPRQVDALAALAILNAIYDDNQKAYDYARKVLDLSPHDPHALMVLGACYENWGLLPEALQSFREAGRMDPLYIYAATNAANVLWMMGRFDEAWSENEKARLLENNNWSVLLTAVRIRYHQGRLDEARRLAEAAEPVLSARERPLAQIFLAWILSRDGQHQKAREILRSVEHSAILEASPNFQLWLADGLALEDQKEQSLEILEKVTKKIPNYPWLARDENLDSLRSDPRFEALLSTLRTQWDGYKARYPESQPADNASAQRTGRIQPKADGLRWFRERRSRVRRSSGSAETGVTVIRAAVTVADRRRPRVGCPTPATYSTDSRIPSKPRSRSITVSASAAVQNGASPSAVATRQKVWHKWPDSV
jgi:eukaryotic-like serine/threonine-protein kinase